MAREQTSNTAGVVAVLVAATGFSWGFVIVKALGLPAGTIAFYRTVIGGAGLAAMAILLRIPRPPRIGAVLAAGGCFAIHQLLFIRASQTTSIAHVTLIAALQPLVVAFVSHRTVGERAPKLLKAWAGLAVAGVGLVVWSNLGAPSRTLFGDILSVVNLFAFTAFFLFSKRARQQGTHTVALTAGMLLSAGLLLAPVVPFMQAAAPGQGWQWGLLALMALGPGNGHLLVNWAHRRVSATLASLVLTAVPLLASLWAHLIFAEPYGWRHVAGMLLVAVAIEGARRAEAQSRFAGAAAPRPSTAR